MAIEDRNLPVGTKLVARYKKQSYVCTVEAAQSGDGVVFALEGGKKHKSPSSAGMEVMGGKAVNGWRFWSVEGDAPATAETPAEAPKPTAPKTSKAKKVIYRNPNQRGVAQGKTRWFCTACMSGFMAEADTEPGACPEGHRNDDPVLAAAPDPRATTEDMEDSTK